MTDNVPHPRFRHRVCMALLSLTVLSTSTAFAADAKRYAASGCRAAYPYHADRLSFGSNGSVTNVSDQGAYVVCPLVRDKLHEPWDFYLITARDQHPTQDVSCTKSIVSPTGSTVETTTVRTSGIQMINGGWFNNICPPWENCVGPNAHAYYAYAMRCYLPGRSPSNGAVSQILGYALYEE